jgi:hypothetical protein
VAMRGREVQINITMQLWFEFFGENHFIYSFEIQVMALVQHRIKAFKHQDFLPYFPFRT